MLSLKNFSKLLIEKFGGTPEDYNDLHHLMFSPAVKTSIKEILLTHNAWFVEYILPKLMPDTKINNHPVSEVAKFWVENYLNEYPTVLSLSKVSSYSKPVKSRFKQTEIKF